MAESKNLFISVFNILQLISVEPYLFFCLFGYTVRLVTLQSLLMDSACRNLHMFSDEICSSLDKHKLQKTASIAAGNNLYAGIMLLSSLPAIIVAIFLGPWSDKYSRKYPLIIAATGMALEATTSAILTSYPNVSPLWYIAASVFAGFSGGFVMSMSAAFSYISDVTDERSRPVRYALLEFSNIAAVILGNILGGEIFKQGSYLPVMIVAPCSFASAIIYCIFVVKETKVRTSDQTISVMMRDLLTVDNIKQSYKTCSRKRPGSIRLQIWLLVWVSCTHRFVNMGTLAIAFSFTKKMYEWDVTDFSQANTAFSVVNAFMTVAIVPLLSNKLRLHEAALGLIGMLSLTAKMVVFSVAYKEPLFYYAWISGCLTYSSGIAIRSRLSKLVNKDELGRAFSLLATCESVMPLLGTLAFVQMSNASSNFFPGLPFLVSAILLIPSVMIFSWMMDLPTISIGEFSRDDIRPTDKQMENIPSTSYSRKKEEKC